MTTDKRRLADRRRLSWRTLVCALTRGRRRGPRRIEERQAPHYVDIYEDIRLLIWSAGIIGFCVLDAFLTLLILQRGGLELNPVMAFLLGISVPVFFYGKYALTAGAILFILLHVNFKVLGIPVRHVLPILFFFYAGLIGYEAFLLSG
ncbi:MAG: DUF5658 family protein [Methylohalobius sp. ZOD2]